MFKLFQHFKSWVIFTFIAIVIISGINPITAQDNNSRVTATPYGNLNVRAEPTVDSEKVGSLSANTAVEVIGRYINPAGELWLLIPYEDNKYWISGNPDLVKIDGNIEDAPLVRLTPGIEPISEDNINRLTSVQEVQGRNLLTPAVWLPDDTVFFVDNNIGYVYAPTGELMSSSPLPMPLDSTVLIPHPTENKVYYLRSPTDFAAQPAAPILCQYHVDLKTHECFNDLYFDRNLTYPSSWSWDSSGTRLMLLGRSWDGEVLDLNTLEKIFTFDGNQIRNCNFFAPNNNQLACETSGELTFYSLIDISSQSIVKTVLMRELCETSELCFDYSSEVLFSQDGSLVAFVGGSSGGGWQTVVADTTTLIPKSKMNCQCQPIQFSPDNAWLMVAGSSSADGIEIIVASVNTGDIQVRFSPLTVFEPQFSPSGKYVLFPTRGSIEVYDIAAGELITELPFTGFKSRMGQPVFSQDGNNFLLDSYDGLSQINLLTGNSQVINEDLNQFTDPLARFTLENEGRSVIVRSFGSDNEVAQIRLGREYELTRMIFSVDGSLVLAPDIREYFTLLDLTTNEQVSRIRDRDLTNCLGLSNLQLFLAVDPQKGIVAFPDGCGGGLYLWAYTQGDDEVTRVPLAYRPQFLHVMADGTLIVLGDENVIYRLDMTTGEEIGTQATPYRPITMVNDDLVFLETDDFKYVAWSMEQEKIIGEPLDAVPVLLSPDGYLMAGFTRGTVVVYGIAE
ncbi:MAG: SH3 domain-containing protein [Anaerolineae bacterium]|nr:SH3 domain-containing protein [Anaerolineae bacterium]